MKQGRQNILALFTFIALVIVLTIQVKWLFDAARMEEKQFNTTVSIALNEAKHDIGKLANACPDMNDFLCGYPCKEKVHASKVAQIDSIISNKLALYNIDLDYTFEVTEGDNSVPNKKIFAQHCYLQCLNGQLEKDGIKIKVEFPCRNQFIWAQLHGTFLLTFFSIIFVMVSFLITSRLFRKERQMLEQTSDFINNMVHEFQTPISNIGFAASLIKKKDKLMDKKTGEYLSVIIKENHKMEKNVEEILKISNNTPNETHTEQVNLTKILSDLIADFGPRVESHKGSILFHTENEKLVINGITAHFKLIFSNLIDNAIKYADKEPQISILLKSTNKKIEISIKDNGPGIEKRHHDLIFEKYYRIPTGDVHNVKGFGLGLTYVKKMIESYNGSIEIHSTKGSGTLFTIYLPLENETH
ncbi:MAG TPA: HAMP domain-containing sensor histidine kinase [Prolixibacteraceae bacterium]|nr:HAMP domain-containing sensor histidine kinase [Prolixibacteraceae bacterium]